MTKRDAVSLFVKMAGLWTLLDLVGGFLMTTLTTLTLRNPVSDDPMWQYNGLLLSGLALAAALCVAIIRGSDNVAAWAVTEDEELGPVGSMAFADWQALGFSMVGLVITLLAFFDLVEQGAMHRGLVSSYGNYPLPEGLIKEQFLPQYLSIAVRLAAGLFLLLRPRGLVNLWQRLQESRRIPGEEGEEL